MRGVDLEVDGLAVDALVVPGDARRLGLDLALDLGEVVEPATRDVQKLAPFLLPGDAGWRVRHVHLVVLVGVVPLAGQVDELQNERAAGDDAAASGQEVSADDVLQHRRLSGRLRADHDLRRLAWVEPALLPRGHRHGGQRFCAAQCLGRRGTYDLGQVEGVIADGVEHQVLQPVDDVEQLLAQRSHGARVWLRVRVRVRVLVLGLGSGRQAHSGSSGRQRRCGGMHRGSAGIACLVRGAGKGEARDGCTSGRAPSLGEAKPWTRRRA